MRLFDIFVAQNSSLFPKTNLTPNYQEQKDADITNNNDVMQRSRLVVWYFLEYSEKNYTIHQHEKL